MTTTTPVKAIKLTAKQSKTLASLLEISTGEVPTTTTLTVKREGNNYILTNPLLEKDELGLVVKSLRLPVGTTEAKATFGEDGIVALESTKVKATKTKGSTPLTREVRDLNA